MRGSNRSVRVSGCLTNVNDARKSIRMHGSFYATPSNMEGGTIYAAVLGVFGYRQSCRSYSQYGVSIVVDTDYCSLYGASIMVDLAAALQHVGRVREVAGDVP